MDKNDYILYDDYAEIILRNRKHEEVARAIINLDDVNKCKLHTWRITRGYVKSGNSQKEPIKQLHRYILNMADRDIKVDHKDRNPLNNRKDNLRIYNNQENSCNQSLSIINTSGITGVNWNKRDNKWRAYIRYKGKWNYLGQYIDKNNAIVARLKGEQEYFGEFAPQQHLFEEYGIV